MTMKLPESIVRFANETIQQAGGPKVLEAAASAVIEADEAVDRSRAIRGDGRADDDLEDAASDAHDELAELAMVSGEAAPLTHEIARQVLELTSGIDPEGKPTMTHHIPNGEE
jgi:hypothetical protein